MRCHFCGWDNPSGRRRCEKCDNPLTTVSLPAEGGQGEETESRERPTDRYGGSGADFTGKATLREPLAADAAADAAGGEAVERCPECHYPLEDGVCACCGYGTVQGGGAPSADGLRRTLRPIRKREEREAAFTLTPVSEETGVAEGDALRYDGDSVTLNRANTSPDNLTITSRAQAVIRLEQGRWYIEDRSEYATTFVQAAEPTELKPGMLILLGNQLFRFGKK